MALNKLTSDEARMLQETQGKLAVSQQIYEIFVNIFGDVPKEEKASFDAAVKSAIGKNNPKADSLQNLAQAWRNEVSAIKYASMTPEQKAAKRQQIIDKLMSSGFSEVPFLMAKQQRDRQS